MADEAHGLTHVEFGDGTLTPACTCGWYSPKRSNAEFERHLRRVTDPTPTAAAERAEEMVDEWRWGYIHGYLHGWSDKAAGRGYGWNRNLRRPVDDG